MFRNGVQLKTPMCKVCANFLVDCLQGEGGPRIRGTQVKSSVRMKKTQESSKWLFLDNLTPEIKSKAPN